MEISMNLEFFSYTFAFATVGLSLLLFSVGQRLELDEPTALWHSAKDRRLLLLIRCMFYGALTLFYTGLAIVIGRLFVQEIGLWGLIASFISAFVLYRVCEIIRWEYMCQDGFISDFFYYLEPLAIGVAAAGACSFFGPSLYEFVTTATFRGFREFMLGNSWMNLLVAAFIMFFCWMWSDGLDDGRGGIKTLFGSSYFPNSGWRSKTVSRFGNGIFLFCLLAVVYRIAFIRTEEAVYTIQTHPVSFVFQESETVRCGSRWCTQISYRARTSAGERSIPSSRVTSGNACSLTDYEGYSVLKDRLTGEDINAWSHRRYARLTISKECTR